MMDKVPRKTLQEESICRTKSGITTAWRLPTLFIQAQANAASWIIQRHENKRGTKKSLKTPVCSRLNEAVFLKSPLRPLSPSVSVAKKTHIQLPSDSLTILYVNLANDFHLTNDIRVHTPETLCVCLCVKRNPPL